MKIGQVKTNNSTCGQCNDYLHSGCGASNKCYENITEGLDCANCANSNKGGCNTCVGGYLDNEICYMKCPKGQYPIIQVDSTSKVVDSATCSATSQCSSNCETCLNTTNYQCTSCAKNFYLLLNSAGATQGQCLSKGTSTSPLYVLYVTGYSNKNLYNYGDDKYHLSLQSAIAKAENACAPYKNCEVRINMLKSDDNQHYMLRSPEVDDFQYKRTQIDSWSGNMKLTIKSLQCGDSDYFYPLKCHSGTEVPIINYKLRDTFTLYVNQYLKIEKVQFNGIDSIVVPQKDTNDCLSKQNQCCVYDSGNLKSNIGVDCVPKFSSTEECVYQQGKPFIEFNAHRNHLLSSTPQLILDQASFQFFLYEFDSFIRPHKIGGEIYIRSSTFQYMSSCGSFIKNTKKGNYSKTNFISGARAQYWDKKQNQVQSSLLIAKPVMVNPAYDMQFKGIILSLQSYNGDITITGSNFNNNILQYTSCDAVYIDPTQSMVTPSAPKHSKNFILDNNNFSNNVGTKGVLYLDFYDRKTTGTVATFSNNEFINNGAYFDGGAIHLRARAQSGRTILDDSSFTDPNYYPCGGYSFTNNVFENVIGCPQYSGSVIKFHCINYNQPLDTTTNNDRYQLNDNLSITKPDLTSGSDQLLFSGNQYIGNAAAFEGAIIELYNAFKVVFENEIYQYNGDSMCDSLSALSRQQFNGLDNCNILYMAQSNLSLVQSQYLMKSVISIKNSKYLSLSNVTFDQNWNIEISDATQKRIASPTININNLTTKNIFLNINDQVDLQIYKAPRIFEILMQRDQQVTINLVDARNIYSTLEGSVASIINDPQDTSILVNSWDSLSITNSYFQNIRNMGTIGAGVFNIDLNKMNLGSQNITITVPNTTSESYSLFYLKKQGVSNYFDINLDTNTYQKCGIAVKGGIFQVQTVSYDNLFVEDTSIYKYLMVSNSGGAIYLTGVQNIQITLTQMSYISTAGDGGAIYCTNCNSPTINLKSMKAQYIFTTGNGGFGYFSTSMTSAQEFILGKQGSSDSYFRHFDSSSSGGVFYIQNSYDLKFTMQAVTVQNISMPNGQGGFLNHQGNVASSNSKLDFSIKYGSISLLIAQEAGFLYSSAYSQSMTLIADTIALKFENIQVLSGNGGLFNLLGYNSVITVTKAQILNVTNENGKGGVFHIKSTNSTTISLNTVKVTNVLCNQDGGFAYIAAQYTDVTQVSNTFTNILAQSGSGGIFRVENGNNLQKKFSISNSNFKTFSSIESGSFLILEDTIESLVDIQIQNSNFICNTESIWTDYTEKIETPLQINQTSIGSLFYLDNQQKGIFNSDTNNFQGCYIASEGGILRLGPDIEFSDTSSKFLYNSAYQGSILYCNGCKATFDSSNITDGVSAEGGIFFWIMWKFCLKMFIYSMEKHSNITFQNCQNPMRYFEASDGNGGFFYIQNSMMKLITTGCYWQDLWAKESGGLIFGGELSSFSLNDCELQNITSGQEGSFFYSTSNQIDFKIQNSFYFDSAVNVSSVGNEFRFCYVTESGSIFSLKNTQFYDEDSKYYQNAALYGGSLYCQNCSINLQNVTFQKMYSRYGGIIFGQDTIKLTIQNVSFLDTQAYQGGIIYATTSTIGNAGFINFSDVIIRNLVVDSSQVSSQGGALFIDNDELVLSFSNIQVNNLTSTQAGGFIYGQSIGQINIQDSQFVEISANMQVLEYNIYQNCQIALEGGILRLQETSAFDRHNQYSNIAGVYGSIYFCNYCQSLTSLNNTYDNIFTLNGGLLYLKKEPTIVTGSMTQNIHISSITCKNFQSYGKGGIVHAYNAIPFTALIQIELSTFTGISSQNSGGLFYLDNALLDFYIKDNNFTEFSAYQEKAGKGGGFYINSIGKIEILRNRFIDFSAALYGSLIYSQDQNATVFMNETYIQCKIDPFNLSVLEQNELKSKNLIGISSAIHMLKGKFVSNTNTYINCYFSEQGGVFQMYQSELYDINSTYTLNSGYYGGVLMCEGCSSIAYYNSTFDRNLGVYGGVFHSKIGSNISISYCKFLNNTAYQDAGVLYIAELTNTLYRGQVIVQDNYFLGSEAKYDGGILYINSLFVTQLTFSNNKVNVSNCNGNGGVGFFGTNYQQKSIITNNIAQFVQAKQEGSFIYSLGVNHVIEIKQNNISCNYEVYAREIIYDLLSNSNFSSTFGGAFYLQKALSVTSQLNMIGYCFLVNQGSIFYLKDVQNFTDLKSNFTKGGAQNGGAILCDTCNMNLNQTHFDDFQALIGGSITILSKSNMNGYQLSIENSYAFEQGGAIAVFVQDQISAVVQNQVNMIECKVLKNVTSGDNGGMIYLQNPFTKLLISNTAIERIGSKNKGGLLYIDRGHTVELLNISVTLTSSKEGSMVYSKSSSVIFLISDSIFDCFQVPNQTEISQSINVYNSSSSIRVQKQPQVLNQESVFFISNAQLVKSTTNIYQNCYVSKEGGIFTLIETNFEDYSSLFENNAAINGGAINCNGGKMTMEGSILQNNQAYVGGAIYLQKEAYLQTRSILIQKNSAYKEAGALYLTQLSYFYLYGTQLNYNRAYESSAIKIFGGSEYFNSTLDLCLVSSNYANTSYTISVDSGQVYMLKTNFRANFATRRTKNIFIIFSRMILVLCKFWQDNHLYQINDNRLNNFTGGFILVGTNSLLHLQESSFENGEAYQGGAIYVSSESYLTVQQSSFKNNYAKSQGGAIFAQTSFDIIIKRQSNFTNNQALQLGDHIYMIDAFVNSILISDSQFNTLQALSSAIYLENIKQVNLTKTLANKIYTNMLMPRNIMQYGGFLRCQKCDQLTIQDSNFTNINSAELGGAIYIQMLDENKIANKKYPKYPSVLILRSLFQNCTAFIGGAIYNDNIDLFTIINSTFDLNQAKFSQSLEESGTASGILFNCKIDLTAQQCQLQLNQSNNFTNNYAELKGGAIHWNVIEVQYNQSLTQFINNTALIYGNDISSVPQQIVFLTQQEYNQYQELVDDVLKYKWKVKEARLLQSSSLELLTSYQMSNYRSGGNFPISYFAVADKYGKVVISNNASNLFIQVNEEYKEYPDKIKYSPILEGSTSFPALNGAYVIQNVQFTGSPGQKYKLDLTTDAIDYRIPSNLQFLHKLQAENRSQISFELVMDLRFCIPGESFSSAGKCQYCEAGISFSLVQMFEPGDCIKCPTDVAICLGGNKIGPQPGFWRKTNSTDRFIECFNYDACLGMLPPENNPLGVCSDGYFGLLCTECKHGYSRSSFSGSTFKCQQCPDHLSNSFKLAGSFILYISLLIFMIRSTLNGAKEEKNVTSIYLKILVNHLQLISLTQSFNFDFPEELVKFFSGTGDVKESTATQILSVDCFMDKRQSDNEQMNPELYFQKLMIIALIPIIIVLTVFVIWSILKGYIERKRKINLGKEWKDKIQTYVKVIKKGDPLEQEVARIQLSKLKQKAQYEIVGKIISTIVILLFFMHPTIVEYSVSNFNCYPIEEERRVKVDLTIKCYEGNHQFFSFAVALPCLLIWGIGIPFFALVLLFKNKEKLTEIETKEKLGFLYNGYKKEYFYWEILIMSRKIIIIFIAIFLSEQGVMAQALIVLAALLIFLALNMKFRPFIINSLNDLETLSITTQIITIYCGIYYISDVTNTLNSAKSLSTATKDSILKSGMMLTTTTKYVLFLLIVFANVLFFVFWGYKIQIDIVRMIIKKFPKIYIFFFMCNDNERFQEMQDKNRVAEVNELLKQEYERILNKLKQLSDSGKLVLTHNILERLSLYLNEQKVLDAINYQRSDLLDAKGNIQKLNDDILGLLRAMREQENKILMNDVLQKDAKIHYGIEDDGYFKNLDENQMLGIDQDFMQGQLPQDDLSINSSSSRVNLSTNFFNEPTDKNFLTDQEYNDFHGGPDIIEFNTKDLIKKDLVTQSNSKQQITFNSFYKNSNQKLVKMQPDKKNANTPQQYQSRKKPDKLLKIQTSSEYNDSTYNFLDGRNKPHWEKEYIRKMKGNLKDEEVYHELWGKEANGDNKEYLQKKLDMQKYKDQRKLMNNFMIPTDMDIQYLDNFQLDNKDDQSDKKNKQEESQENMKLSNVTFNKKTTIADILNLKSEIVIQAKKPSIKSQLDSRKKQRIVEEMDEKVFKMIKDRRVKQKQDKNIKVFTDKLLDKKHLNVDDEKGKIDEDMIMNELVMGADDEDCEDRSDGTYSQIEEENIQRELFSDYDNDTIQQEIDQMQGNDHNN
eukprot:403349122